MIGKLLTGGALLAAGGLGYGLIEARRFVVREFTLPVLPAGQNPIRVLHLSDIHLLPRQRHKLGWLRELSSLAPDLVVNTGDNLSGPDSIDPLLDAWGPLLGVPGVFVFGSNDYTRPRFKNPLKYFNRPPARSRAATIDPSTELPWRRLRDAMLEAGWADLDNARAELEVAGRRLAFRGTDDAHLKLDRYDLVAGPPVASADLNIGVTHAPYLRVLDAMAADRMELILAGHTHGGQVCLPFKGALVTNCDLDPARVKGVSCHTAAGHTSSMHVSAGMGSSPFAPYRTFCRPEASLLTLTARPS